MMKKRVCLILAFISLVLSACNAASFTEPGKPRDEESDESSFLQTEMVLDTESATVSEHTNPDTAVEEEVPFPTGDVTKSSGPDGGDNPMQSTAEPSTGLDSQATVAPEFPTATPITPVTQPPATTEPVSTDDPPIEETPSVPPGELTPTQPSQTAPIPTEPETPTEIPVESFNIQHWISFAQNYAVSVGLCLDSSATECWDNPISADAHCIYLERDLTARLNRYARDSEITDVWIWAVATGDNAYDIYIGYA